MSKNKIVSETVLKHLKRLYISMTNIRHQNYKIIDDKKFVYLPTIYLQDEFGLSAFQQRSILKELELEGFINIKLGHQRKRYFIFNEKRKKPKNIDKIRQMNSEELTIFIRTLLNCNNYVCNECPLSIYTICENLGKKESLEQWLEQEVEE